MLKLCFFAYTVKGQGRQEVRTEIHFVLQPVHIFSDVTGVTGCLGHPHPGDPAEGEQAPTGVQVARFATFLPLLNRSQLEAFTAASRMSQSAFSPTDTDLQNNSTKTSE